MRARVGFRRGFGTAFAAVFACSWSGPLHAQEGGVAFVDVSVVRVDRGDVLPGRTVVVADGRIVEQGPKATTETPRDALVIDGRGRFLLPGLIHLSGHLHGAGNVRPEDVLLLYLTRGVTTVRAPDSQEVLGGLRRNVERGRVPGPHLVLDEDGSAPAPHSPGDRLIELLLRDSPPEAMRDGTPLDLLRSATAEAAATLGADDIGRVDAGARADLILLEGDPRDALSSLQAPVGVMANGRWHSRAQLEREVEGRARDLVLEYGRIPSRTDLPSTCTGTTLHDCFGGEQRCAGGNGCSRAHLARERAVLIGRLELLGSIFPKNDWILGQRVNAAVEHAQVERARAVADRCQGTLWWCQALRGYALHLQGDPFAELRFDSAMASAPPEQLAWVNPGDPGFDDRTLRCEWNDLRYLVHGSLLGAYRSRPCGENPEFEQLFWWLADPLWSAPGNPRRSEHLYRIVQMRLHDDQGRERGAHVQVHHWTVMPAGVANSWRTVAREVRGQNEDRRELFVDGGYSFVPDERRFMAPLTSTADDWAVALGEGDERMITRETWHNLDHQDVVLHREGRLLFLTAARPPTLLDSYDGVRATLAMGRPADHQVDPTPATIDEVGVVRASTELDDESWIASLEVQGEGWVGRARHGLRPPVLANGFGLSEPVLVDERFESGLPLLDAVLPSTSLGGRPRVGVYFEVYGASPNEPLLVSVSAERTNRSLLRRLTGALRLTTEASLNVAWQEAAETPLPNLMTRYLAVDVSGLDAGDYRLTLVVQRADGTLATSSREISTVR